MNDDYLDPSIQDDDSGDTEESGENADLESDDNALDAAQEMGLYQNADEEHPAELGLGNQLDEADEEDLEDA